MMKVITIAMVCAKIMTKIKLISIVMKIIMLMMMMFIITVLREGFKKKNYNFYGIFQKGGGGSGHSINIIIFVREKKCLLK